MCRRRCWNCRIKNAVIKAQIPTGILLLIVNVFLLYFLMFL
ncbi:FIG001614: Membrane protein [Klebsiella pneumoniae IS39]|nr:FIG001614: Membrane protein [Klebsiella pneumoniae IS39]